MANFASRRKELSSASNTVRGATAWTDVQEKITQIVQDCQKGDHAAQRRLYEVSHQNVYRLMVRMVGLQDAADVTQQVFLQAFRKIGQFSARSQFGTWMYRVAVNEALQHLRRSKRSRLRTLEQEPMDRSSNRQENTDDKELLEQALALLEPELRSAFLLREVEGLSYSELADALEIPSGTVGSRLNRARRELKQHLIELGWET
jgi:RNA polymerase sigma-70 factor (ECF subfamily)